MRSIVIAGLLVLAVVQTRAQSKVFKEVSDDISSQILSIQQDNLLVGYVAFTQLEKASADSFNYRLTIMDENLNDIGVVNFRQQKLVLQNAAFEQDVLCLGYLKSNLLVKKIKSWKSLEKAEEKTDQTVLFQFLNLQGTILKTEENPVHPSFGYGMEGVFGGLTTSIQIKNIPQYGFVCFYEDTKDKNLLAFDLTGAKKWSKKVLENDATFTAMVNTTTETYLLMKRVESRGEGAYELFPYSSSSGKAYPKYELKDKKGQYLKVLAFGIDPATGKPFISGNILDQQKRGRYDRAKDIVNGAFAGVYTVNVGGPEKSNIKQQCSYWNDGSQASFKKDGSTVSDKKYAIMRYSFRDQEGNTYFAGSSFKRKLKIGSTIATAVTLPLIFPPIIIAAGGYSKVKLKDAVIVKQDTKGNLTVTDNVVCSQSSRYFPAWQTLNYFENKRYYSVSSGDVKNSHFILNDGKKIIVYNLKSHKEERSIAVKDGSVRTDVFPAKEGHILISEYDKKEKSTRISIESL